MTTTGLSAFLDAIRQGHDEAIASRAPLDALEIADGERYLAALIEGALTFVHADPAQPLFIPWTTPDRRWSDNGADSAYWIAPVDRHHRYRISGRRADECYLSFTVYGGAPAHPETISFNANHRDLGVGPGETYALDINPTAADCYVIARQYFLRPGSDRAATMSIEVTAGPAPTVPDAATLSAKWDTAAQFVRHMAPLPQIGVQLPAYVSTTPNVMGDPSAWTSAAGAGRGTPDQIYAMGAFELGDEEALVMEVQFPRCAYASATLWQRFGQSIDTRLHSATINCLQVPTSDDGTARLVVAHRNPGLTGWLDTGGHRRGSVFWRFLLADHAPPPIRCEVVKLDALTAGS